MEHVRRPRSAADALGRRRSLSAAVTAGALIRTLQERLGPELRDLGTDEDTVEFTIDGARVVETLTLLRDDPDLAFFFLADAAAVDYGIGERFEVVYHLLLRPPSGVAAGPCPRRPRRPAHPLDHVAVGGGHVPRARDVRHDGHRLRGQSRPAPDLHVARLQVVPAAQGLHPARRRCRFAGARREPARAARDVGPHPVRRCAHGQRSGQESCGRTHPPTVPSPATSRPTRADRDDRHRSRDPDPGPDRAGSPRGGAAARGRRPGADPRRGRRVRRLRHRRHPRPPAADGARAGRLHARRGRDAGEHGSPAPVDPRRDAARGQGAGRDRGGRRPGARVPAPRHREAVRERHLHDGAHLRRPDGLPGNHAQRARPGDRVREAVRHQGTEARGVHPRPGRRAEPRVQPRPDDGLPGARHRRAHADPVQLHQPRRSRRHAERDLAGSGCCSTSSGSAA